MLLNVMLLMVNIPFLFVCICAQIESWRKTIAASSIVILTTKWEK